MKLYGIYAEWWTGSGYSCNPVEDIRIFMDSGTRDKEFAELHSNGEVRYYKFDTETED